jgi:hypothetical protein
MTMKHHVHPETYDPNDAFEHRRYQLHTEKWLCEATWCTYAEMYEWAQKEPEQQAKALKAEIHDAEQAEIAAQIASGVLR